MLTRPFALALCLILPAAAAAQIIPPIPPAAEKTPPYEPPAPPTPPPAPAATPAPSPEPETPLPSIIQRDANGNLVPLTAGAEETAIRAFTFDDQAKALIESQIKEHHAEMDKRVLENLPLAISIAKARETIGAINDLGQLQTLARSLAPLRPTSLLDRLTKSNAISARQRARADQVVKAYADAATAQTAKDAGENNVQQLINLSGQRAFMEVSGEAARSLDRIIAAAAPTADQRLKAAGLSADQQTAASSLLKSAEPPAGFRRVVLEVLTAEQAEKVLR